MCSYCKSEPTLYLEPPHVQASILMIHTLAYYKFGTWVSHSEIIAVL